MTGWNCRHDFFPFFEGISKPSAEKFDSEEKRKEHENSQKQRAYERKIRATKRKFIAYDSAISETSDAALKLKLTGKFSRTSVTLKRQEPENIREVYNNCYADAVEKRSENP